MRRQRQSVAGVSMRLRSIVLCLTALLVVPGVARADVWVSPFFGTAFSGDVREPAYGGTFGVGGLIGVEVDFGYSPVNVLDDELSMLDLNADVTTVMGNLVVRVPAGPFRPYASGGVGLIRLRLSADFPIIIGDLSIAEISSNQIGMNVGGGVNLHLTDNVAIRGDARYFRTFEDLSFSDFHGFDVDFDDFVDIGDVPLPRIDFGRITGGVTFSF
jgi:opacity protein-like surface antigen